MPWSWNLAHFLSSISDLFSNTFLALLGILFCSRVSPFCTEISVKIDMRAFFQYNFISKANLKIPEQLF